MPENELAKVNKTSFILAELHDSDERGVIWIWEQPRASSTYVLGVDTTVGITGWTRELRVEEDAKIDNAVIQVLRVGKPDVQVAEFAAPIDQYELAKYVNFLGRMYAGNSDEQQALACIEMNNGGWATQTELINRYGYTNLPPWRYESGLTPFITKKYGWYSNQSTRRDLWIMGMRHINAKLVKINSPWLVEEMTDCTWDNFLSMTARASYNSHDDRVVSLLISCWYAHEWSLELDHAPESAPIQRMDRPDYQRSDMSYDEMISEANENFARLTGDQ